MNRREFLKTVSATISFLVIPPIVKSKPVKITRPNIKQKSLPLCLS